MSPAENWWNPIVISSFPEGFTIPRDATALHGITTKMALDQGEHLITILELLDTLVAEATLLVAHNMRFDEKIIGVEFIRNKMNNALAGKSKICTMESATPFCRIPGRYGYKWPKLSELHYKLFREYFEEAHNATVDIAAYIPTIRFSSLISCSAR